MGGKGSKTKKGATADAKFKTEMKLVVLGIAASGKSTFTRQMRILHKCSWTKTELDNFHAIIIENIWEGLKAVAAQMKKEDIIWSNTENQKRMRYFLELTERPALSDEAIARITAFWTDDATVKAAKHVITEIDHQYFINKAETIAQENYVPSDEDILHLRQRSTGATETSFILQKNKFTLIDMGGQKPERTKWDKALQAGLNGIFFFVAVEEFDTPSNEDRDKSKLEISLQTWKELLEDFPGLSTKSLFVLFNKIDLLDEKLANDSSCFKKFYPDCTAATRDGVLDYIKSLYKMAVPAGFNTQYISYFNCCALDTELMGNLFTEAKVQLFNRKLDASGLKL